jgi:transaldolase
MALKEKNVEAIYETLSQCDVQNAADEFRSVYEETDGKDGYVSLEVNPHLAHDTKGTIEEARRLWIALNRPNVFIKVPATSDGLPAIQQLISEGINVNVTLLFGLPRYRRVAEAYIAGLEARVAQGKPVKYVASVASFFVSRIDTMVNSSSQAVRKRKLRRRCADKWLSRVLRRLIKSTRRFLEVIDLRSWLLRVLVYSGCSGPALAPRTRTMVM